ncbi:MAG: PEP-CTERM/exosortase system-associated acyltransferase [Desulforegulaceae bacterium]|nr:PEP-CTERM/exosortase system-associated acyltransferase [Desulforegulaceae bacterium]
MEISGYRFLCIDDDEELMEKAYKLRYSVYCKEVKYLNPDDYDDSMEIDEFDKYSIHFAALNENNEVLGTLRLVLNSDLGFPLEHHCREYDKTKIDFSRNNLAEISRLAVDKSFRRRKDDGMFGVESYDGDANNEVSKEIREKRKRPIIVVGLYKMMYMESKRRGITHWYAAMEEKLNKALNHFSFKFEAIGPVQDYSGPVIPFLGNIQEIEEEVFRNKPELLHLMVYGLESSNMPKFGVFFPLKNLIFIKIAKLMGKI